MGDRADFSGHFWYFRNSGWADGRQPKAASRIGRGLLLREMGDTTSGCRQARSAMLAGRNWRIRIRKWLKL